MKCLKAIIYVMLILLMTNLSMNVANAEQQTVLLYMLGCDLEADSGAATNDIMEIIHTSANSAVRIVAYLGGSKIWWIPELKDEHCYVIEIKNGNFSIINDYRGKPSANEESFGSFLKMYGTDGNDLILWGHGFPGFMGIGEDNLAENDKLSLQEIQNGLQASGLHFRLLGFDACEMATIEAVWPLASYAEWFAASSQEEALSGWDYRVVLNCLEFEESDAPMKLREASKRASRRNLSFFPLTVINNRLLLQHAESISHVLDTSLYSQGLMSLEELAINCHDQTAGDAVRRLLDGQIMMISNPAVDVSVTLPGIQDSYIAFLNRR